jgi:glycosyltransferase involved in cell wall biosynthesis
MRCPGCAAEHYGWTKGIVTLMANAGMGIAERRLVDLFIPVSRAVAAGNGLLGTAAPVRIVPNFVMECPNPGVDEPGVQSYLSALPREPYFLFVGAFAAYKGVDVLLSAYADLCDAPPLVIIGYGTAEYPVSTVRAPQGVTIVKNWPHRVVMEAWRRSLVGVVPSIWGEPFGLVVLEAMAMGRPVIASAVGGLQEMVTDDETGLVVRPGDPTALRDAMQRLLYDKNLRENLGRAAKQRVAQFDARVVVPQIEEAYEDLLRVRS